MSDQQQPIQSDPDAQAVPPAQQPEAGSSFGADWVDALNEFHDVVKTQTANVPTKAGGSYSYGYVDLAAITGLARSILSRFNLAVNQQCGTDPQSGHVQVTTTIYHRSGGTLTFGPLVMPSGKDAQQVGSAITYARRYSLMAVLGLATEDDDGAAAQKPEEPHPLSDRVGKVMAELKGLSDADKEAVKAWADGRSFAGSALLGDEDWLQQVESWLDERQLEDERSYGE